MSESHDLYEIIQVHQAAQPEVIEAAYRRLARMYHPDVNASPEATEAMVRINRAYEVLRDPAKRAAYDRERQAASAQPAPEPRPREPSAPPTVRPGSESAAGDGTGQGAPFDIGLLAVIALAAGVVVLLILLIATTVSP